MAEDNAEVARFAAALLQEMGYSARSAANAAEALALLEADGPVDAVLSDVVMPAQHRRGRPIPAGRMALNSVSVVGNALRP